MAKQVFIVNADSDLTVSVGAAASNLAGIVAGAKEVALAANGQVSVDVDGGELVRVATLAYNAGTSQEATVVLGSGTYVKVINTTIGTMNLPMKTFTGSAAQIAAAITAAGGDFEAFTATEAAGTITVSAAVNSSFRLATDGGAITYTVSGVPSTGTAADVAALEAAGLPYSGVTNKVGFPVIKPASLVAAGGEYTLIVADFVTVASSKAGMNAVKGEDIKMIFAVESAATATLAGLAGALANLA